MLQILLTLMASSLLHCTMARNGFGPMSELSIAERMASTTDNGVAVPDLQQTNNCIGLSVHKSNHSIISKEGPVGF